MFRYARKQYKTLKFHLHLISSLLHHLNLPVFIFFLPILPSLLFFFILLSSALIYCKQRSKQTNLSQSIYSLLSSQSFSLSFYLRPPIFLHPFLFSFICPMSPSVYSFLPSILLRSLLFPVFLLYNFIQFYIFQSFPLSFPHSHALFPPPLQPFPVGLSAHT